MNLVTFEYRSIANDLISQKRKYNNLITKLTSDIMKELSVHAAALSTPEYLTIPYREEYKKNKDLVKIFLDKIGLHMSFTSESSTTLIFLTEEAWQEYLYPCRFRENEI